MIFNTQKFKKEIDALASLRGQRLLHPLKREQLKQEIFSRLGETPQAIRRLTWQERRIDFMRYVISILTGLALFGGTALASSNSLPGDVLYPIKLAKEKIEVSFAFTVESEAKVETRHAEKRLEELGKIRFQAENLAEVNIEIANIATSSAPESNNNSQKPKKVRAKKEIEVHAETAAQTQIQKAITALTKVQTKLEAEGNANAAAQIGTNILKLQAQAESQNIQLEARGEVRGASENNNDGNKKDDRENKDGSSGDKKIEIQNRLDGIIKVD